MKIIVILLFLLVIVVVLYILNKMNTDNFIDIIGGDYFSETYEIEGQNDSKKRLERFRYDDTTPLKEQKEKEKEYKSYIKELNSKPLDINFKLKFITNLLMNTISYEDATNILDKFSSVSTIHKKYDNYTYDIVNNIPNVADYLKEHKPSLIASYDKYYKDPKNASSQLIADSIGRLQHTIGLMDKDNPIKKDICKILGINDFTMLTSRQSYHKQPAADCMICSIRSFVPGMFEESSDNSIENSYSIRKLIKVLQQDMIGIRGTTLVTEHPIIKEIPMNFITVKFGLDESGDFGMAIATNSNIIKGAPFIITNDIRNHVEPFFIDVDGKSTDATELKTILNSSTDDIPKYIDTLHQYACKNSLSMIYRNNLKDLQRTFNVDPKNEKKLLKQAYKLTTDRLNSFSTYNY